MTRRGDLPEKPTRARWRARWGRLGPLGRDITVVLIVKLAALTVLWWAFFSQPLAPQMRVDPPRVGEHLFPATNPEPSAHAAH